MARLAICILALAVIFVSIRAGQLMERLDSLAANVSNMQAQIGGLK